MKKHTNNVLLVFFFLLLVTQPAISQMTVNIGNDTTFCAGQYPDTMYLGTNLIIENGIEPYLFSWKCKYELSQNLVFTASDFLNDTTLASPYFKGWVTETEPEKIKFYLKVIDANSKSALDSVNVSFSGCSCPTGTIVVEISKGDSIWLDAGGPKGKYYKYKWEPSYGLTRSDSSATWCKPEVNTLYSLVSVDTFGCTCSCGIYDIRVLTTGIDETNLIESNLLNIWQEGQKIYFENPSNKEATISILSLSGGVLHTFKCSDNNFEIDTLPIVRGIYIIKIHIEGYTGNIKITNL